MIQLLFSLWFFLSVPFLSSLANFLAISGNTLLVLYFVLVNFVGDYYEGSNPVMVLGTWVLVIGLVSVFEATFVVVWAMKIRNLMRSLNEEKMTQKDDFNED